MTLSSIRPQLSFSRNYSELLTQSEHSLAHSKISKISETSLENHIGSVLVLTEDKKILYATESLKNLLQESPEDGTSKVVATQEIGVITDILKQCRDAFPQQNWAIDFDIFTKDSITLRIRSRWIKLEGLDSSCILLIVEDRQQLVKDIVLNEAQQWGLTTREQEIWLLHQQGYSYREIAEKLFICISTVKKHMRSVHAKRRAQDEV
ncbi:MAG: helix-turn-helix transcriptional regulator [Leptolyngbyaceae cyanobacterium]